MVTSLLLYAVAHVPPSPAEYAHLERLRAAHAADVRGRKLASEPDYSCPVSSGSDKASVEATWRVTGTSLGGWLVLEPWLTPSLFYQFLGADIRYGPDIDRIKQKTGMDQKSFCTALGPAEVRSGDSNASPMLASCPDMMSVPRAGP